MREENILHSERNISHWLTSRFFIIIFVSSRLLRNKPQKEKLKKILKDYLIKNERICVRFVNRSRSNQFKEIGLTI